jgi:signal transduction histidine kinase/CheY-like chemotaxis protein/HPt (histidine-containing phosphotransfer) domain-containing protein
MPGKKIILYILAAFIAGNLLLIYIQYNSAKNVNTLIKGNEKLVEEFKVGSELKELKLDVISVESKIRGTVTTQDSSHIKGLEIQIAAVQNNLDKLQKISDDDTSVKYIDVLDRLVQEKFLFSQKILDSFRLEGKMAAENLIGMQRGKALTDSIVLITDVIDNSRQKLLATVTSSNDKSGKRALSFSSVLIILVLVSGAILFWFIINTIRNQGRLIQQLNSSEKKVREAAKVKENFMANMSHEIRTPMNAILGFTNLLQRKNIDQESKEYVRIIEKSGENLLTIVNDILDLSKIEAGMMRIEPAPFNIRSLLHSVEAMFKARADEKQIKLSSYVDESLPAMLEVDANRLTQILVNLVGNALKFTGSGSVSVKVTNEGIVGNKIKTSFVVTDTGIGIEKEKMKQIFERFKQAEDSVTRKYGGTGLGLSIVNDLVLLQNGTIAVESEPGKGTTFKFMIPYKIATEKNATNTLPETDLTERTVFNNTCVLLVEDNEINQTLIKHLFKNWQLDFEVAENGKEAIEKLRTKKYDLILMDIQMPEMDGYTASAVIRNELKLDTAIIAITAHAMAGEREKCIGYGMNEYIQKPIREKELYDLIEKFIAISKPGKLDDKSLRVEKGYKHINLQYMKEVSNGNADYEKTVTEQFIEAIPQDLQSIENAWLHNDISQMRHQAHNMKTTISVMGLNELLQPYLDALEYDNMSAAVFEKNFSFIKTICAASVEDARLFYSSL